MRPLWKVLWLALTGTCRFVQISPNGGKELCNNDLGHKEQNMDSKTCTQTITRRFLMYSSRKHIFATLNAYFFKRFSKSSSRAQGRHFVRAKFLWQQTGGLRGLEFKYLYRPHFVWTNRAVKIPTLFVAKSLGSQARGLRLAGWCWCCYSLPSLYTCLSPQALLTSGSGG